MSGGTVELAVPPEVAFDWFADPVNRPLWQASLRRVEDVEGSPREGQTWVDVTKPGLRPLMRTTRYERPRVWAESGTWHGVRADLTMTFEADQGGCLARVDFTIVLPGPLRRAGALVSLVSAPAVLLDVRKAGRLLAETA